MGVEKVEGLLRIEYNKDKLIKYIRNDSYDAEA